MGVNFKEVMAKHSDEGLLGVVSAKPGDYKEEAILAAQNELDNRKVPFEKVAKAKEEQAVVDEKASVVANEPLESEIKVFAIMLPLLARLSYASKFREGGYERKLAEMASAYWIGRLIYIGLIILFITLIKLL